MQAVVDLTQDLIRFKTMHNQPEEIQRCMAFIEDYLNTHQLGYTRIEDGGYPSILMMPEGSTAKVLLMAHIDVVDAADELFQVCGREARYVARADQGADTGAGDTVDRDLVFLENLEHAHVRSTFGAAAGQLRFDRYVGRRIGVPFPRIVARERSGADVQHM